MWCGDEASHHDPSMRSRKWLPGRGPPRWSRPPHGKRGVEQHLEGWSHADGPIGTKPAETGGGHRAVEPDRRTHPTRSQRGAHRRIRDRFRDPQSHFDFEIHRYGSAGSFLGWWIAGLVSVAVQQSPLLTAWRPSTHLHRETVIKQCATPLLLPLRIKRPDKQCHVSSRKDCRRSPTTRTSTAWELVGFGTDSRLYP